MTDSRRVPSRRRKPDVVVDLPARPAGEPPLAVNVWVTVESQPPSVGPATVTAHPSSRSARRDVRIGDDEPLPVALQRICLEQLDRARQALEIKELDVGIHTARKAMKRIRAILRLCRDEIGLRVYRPENVILRDAARRIAPVRDSAVVSETLDALLAKYEAQLAPGAFDELRRELEARHDHWRNRVSEDGSLDEVKAILDGTRTRFADWPTEPTDPLGRPPIRDDVAAIAPGIGRTYRRGRRAMFAAQSDGSVANYHEWRKRSKYLRFQLETLEPLWPPVLRGLATSADRLAELLGSDHDLAVLAELVDDLSGGVIDPKATSVLAGLTARERLALQEQAVPVGARLYAESPGRFVDRLGSYWSAWRPNR